jgi:hypothetical protein
MGDDNIYCEERAKSYVNDAENTLLTYINMQSEAAWAYGSNITEANQLRKAEASAIYAVKKRVSIIFAIKQTLSHIWC